MTEIQLGKRNRLTAVREVDFGYYLEGTVRGTVVDVLLPKGELVPEAEPITQLPQETDVFIYLDHEERIVATQRTPKAEVGQFAYLEVAWVNNFGAFMDWGLQKDLFVPFREQKMKMQKGKGYVVHLHIDPDSYRIVASAKVERYLSEDMPYYRRGEKVDILVWQKTDLGFKVIVDNRFGGLLYQDQIFRPITTGDRMEAYIKQIREDGKIDLMLQPEGKQATKDFSDILLDYLKEQGGHAPIGDRTPAEEVYRIFGVSKKVFKRAIGDLYKRRLILVLEDGLQLNIKK